MYKINVNEQFINYVVEEYSDMIVRLGMIMLKNKADAEDIMQSVFMKLIKQQEFISQQHVKAWLIKVTANACKDVLKSANRRMTVPLENRNYDLDRHDYGIIEAISMLPANDRTVIFMFYYEGYSAKEIGEILGKREVAIHTRLSRARKQLKNIFEEQEV